MGAWIEINLLLNLNQKSPRSHPTMGAWIEIHAHKCSLIVWVMSHPTMGAWIEISPLSSSTRSLSVAPHDGCVD